MSVDKLQRQVDGHVEYLGGRSQDTAQEGMNLSSKIKAHPVSSSSLTKQPPDTFWAVTLLRMVDELGGRGPVEPACDPVGADQTFQSSLARLHAELVCAECGGNVTSPSSVIYCSERCGQIAATARFIRKAVCDGRGETDEALVIGLGTRLISHFKGGYPARARALGRTQREAVFVRDGRNCTLCGAPADQVDHVHGNSSDPSNLRATCASCNRQLAMTMMAKPTRKQQDEFLELAAAICCDLAERAAAPVPTRCCDDDERWSAAEPGLRMARRELLQEGLEADETDFEDVDGYLHDAMQKDD